MITGNGTAESHYIISGNSAKETWDDMLSKIKENGVYVELDKDYAFDLDKIYGDSAIPNHIPIGYKTVLDGKNSVVISEKVTWSEDGVETEKTCDFQGSRADILNFSWLGCDYNQHYLSDTWDRTENLLITETSLRIKCTPNITYNAENLQDGKIISIKGLFILQGNGLTIESGRDVLFEINGVIRDALKSQIYDTNFLDLTISSPYTIGGRLYSNIIYNSNGVDVFLVKYKRCKFTFLDLTSISTSDVLRNFYCESCNLTIVTNSIKTIADKGSYNIHLKDCNFQIKGYKFDNYYTSTYGINNCNVYGETSDTSLWHMNGFKQTIFKVKTDAVLDAYNTYPNNSNYINSGLVINSDLAPNGTFTTTKVGVTNLTTDEIHDRKKLYAAGMLINPNGG